MPAIFESRASALECVRLSPQWIQPLILFWNLLKDIGDDRYFHPHPFTVENAKKYAEYAGQDLFYVFVEGPQVLGYGMLRGWDEGYDIPSLGIAIHPAMRRSGLGKCFMYFLHMAARQRGAKNIRLKVYPDNLAAVKLYRRLGYRFVGQENGELIGILELM